MSNPTEAANKDKYLLVHGRIYKAHSDPSGDYKGTLWTEKNCRDIISAFNTKKLEEGRIPVNMSHSSNKGDILGFVEALYLHPSQKSIGAIFTVYPSQRHFAEIKKRLDNFETKLKENEGDMDKISMKDLVGLSIEGSLAYSGVDKNNNVIDIDNLAVTDKKFTGLAIVDNPDHYQDGTFVYSFAQGSNTDLLKKDLLLQEYLNTPDADKAMLKFFNYQPNRSKDEKINIPPGGNEPKIDINEQKDVDKTHVEQEPIKIPDVKKINNVDPSTKENTTKESISLLRPNSGEIANSSAMSSEPTVPPATQLPVLPTVPSQDPVKPADQNAPPPAAKKDNPLSLDNPEMQDIISKAIEKHMSKKRKQAESSKDSAEMEEDTDQVSESKTKKARFAPEVEKQNQAKKPESQDAPKPILAKVDETGKRRSNESDMLQVESYTKSLQDLVKMKSESAQSFYQKEYNRLQEETKKRHADILESLMGDYEVNNPDNLPTEVKSELNTAFSSESNFYNSPLVTSVLAARSGRQSHSMAERQFNSVRNQKLNGYTGDVPAYTPEKQKEASPFDSAKSFLAGNKYNSRYPTYPQKYNNPEEDGMEVDIPEQSYQSVPQYRNGAPFRQQPQREQKRSYENQNSSQQQRRMGFNNNQASMIVPKPQDKYLEVITDFIHEDFGTELTSPFITTQSQALNDFKLATSKLPYLTQGCGGLFGKNIISTLTKHNMEDLENAMETERVIHPQVLAVALHNFARGGTALSAQQKYGLNSSVNFNSFVGEIKPMQEVEGFYT